MSQGIGLLTSPGDGGRTELLLLLDVVWCCPGCGHEQQERYYRATPLHPCTLARLEQRLDHAPAGVQASCEQCDQPMDGADAVERWSLQTGFPGGHGLLQGFADRAGGRSWRLSPHQRLDVQLLPVLEPPEDIASVIVERLSESTCLDVFHRCWNPKSALRQALLHHPPAPGSCVAIDPTPGLRIVIADADDADQALALMASRLPDAWVTETLVAGGEPARGWLNGPAEWLGDLLPSRPRTFVVAAADPAQVAEAAQTIVESFPMRITIEATTPTTCRLIVEGAPEDAVTIQLDQHDVATEAARTLICPRDATRVELDRAIVWIGSATASEEAGT